MWASKYIKKFQNIVCWFRKSIVKGHLIGHKLLSNRSIMIFQEKRVSDYWVKFHCNHVYNWNDFLLNIDSCQKHLRWVNIYTKYNFLEFSFPRRLFFVAFITFNFFDIYYGDDDNDNKCFFIHSTSLFPAYWTRFNIPRKKVL